MKKYASYKVYPKLHLQHSQLNNFHTAKQLIPTTYRRKPSTQKEIGQGIYKMYNQNRVAAKETKEKEHTTKNQDLKQNTKSNNSIAQLAHHNGPTTLQKTVSEKNFFKMNSPGNPTSYESKYQLPLDNREASRSARERLGMNSPKADVGVSYANLKQKINDIAGKLQQIRKDYQLSQIHKKKKSKYLVEMEGQKSSSHQNKENVKNILNIVDKHTEKTDIHEKENLLKERIKNNSAINNLLNTNLNVRETVPNNIGKVNSPRQKDDKSKSTIIVSRLENKQNSQPGPVHQKIAKKTQKRTPRLDDFVTKYVQQPAQLKKLSQCVSQKNILPPSNLKHKNLYYIGCIVNAYNTQNPTSFDQLCRSHIVSSLEILKFMKQSNMIAKALSNSCKPANIAPIKSNKSKTIVFDLDQTLIHCNQSLKQPCDLVIPIKFPESVVIKAGINIRPYAVQCLKELSRHFQVMVFTASHEFYANVIIDHLDPNHEYVSHRFFRDSCHRTEQGFYVKDLRIIDRELKNVLLIDNAAYSYGFQPQNGIPIIPFYDNQADLELKSLVGYLKGFVNQDDVRRKNSQIMGIQRYGSFTDPEKLINQLYL